VRLTRRYDPSIGNQKANVYVNGALAAYNPGTDGFTSDTTGAYRLFPSEAISFGQRLRFTIQHGPVDDMSANYSSVAFWYGQRWLQLS
jgi:hypothetical protein